MKKVIIGLLLGTMISATFSATRPYDYVNNNDTTALVNAILYVGDCIKDNTLELRMLRNKL